MRSLPGNHDNPQWDNKLIAQLSFIKKHLRYPLNKTTLAPALLVFALITIGIRFGFASYLVGHSGGAQLLTLIIILSMLLPVIFGIYRYIQTLRFVSVHTPYDMAQNMHLVQQFLGAMHLAVFQHPEAPEVIQIISSNIHRSGDRPEQREVMVFIADDKRILVNSHFTNTRFTLVQSAGNYKKMAAGLQKWVDKSIKNNDTAISRQDYF